MARCLPTNSKQFITTLEELILTDPSHSFEEFKYRPNIEFVYRKFILQTCGSI
jgi:hypothetical protein